tara:strand:- start:98 stop:490 length:393 start_codon:yes stop_codon:yes gene_type:complete
MRNLENQVKIAIETLEPFLNKSNLSESGISFLNDFAPYLHGSVSEIISLDEFKKLVLIALSNKQEKQNIHKKLREDITEAYDNKNIDKLLIYADENLSLLQSIMIDLNDAYFKIPRTSRAMKMRIRKMFK